MTLILGIVLGAVAAVGVMAFGGILLYSMADRPRRQTHRDSIEDVAIEAALATDDGQTARAIDPENPPRWMTNSPSSPKRIPCVCHGIPFQQGDQVLWWPIPGHPDGAVDLFCERTVEEAQP